MKLVKYMIVGGVAAVTDIAIFFVFAKLLGMNYLLVAAGGFVLATLVNYILSIRHVFDSLARFRRKQEIFMVYFVSLVGLAVNQLVLYLAIDLILIEMMIAKLIATGCVFLWNYAIRNHYIFKEPACTNRC